MAYGVFKKPSTDWMNSFPVCCGPSSFHPGLLLLLLWVRSWLLRASQLLGQITKLHLQLCTILGHSLPCSVPQFPPL